MSSGDHSPLARQTSPDGPLVVAGVPSSVHPATDVGGTGLDAGRAAAIGQTTIKVFSVDASVIGSSDRIFRH